MKAWAAKSLPILEQHYQMAQQTSRGAVGTSGSQSSPGGSGATGTRGTTGGQTPRGGSDDASGGANTVPCFENAGWFGLMAPAKTPQAIVMKLNKEINDSFHQPDVKEALLKLGALAAPSTPDEMRSFLKAELAKWTPVIQAAGIKSE